MSRDLLSTTKWANRNSSDHDLNFVKKPKKAADLITAAEAGPLAPLEVRVRPGESNKQTRAKQKMTAFIEAVKGGLTPEDAAQRIGVDLGEVSRISSAADMRDIVSRTLEMGHIRSDILKEYLRASRNTMLTEAFMEGDRKGFSDLYKLAASDPEIGLTGPSVAIQNNIDLSGIEDILAQFNTPANGGSTEAPQNVSEITIDTVTEQT